MWNKNRLEQVTRSSNLVDMIRRVRILVIDDVDTEFPFDILKREGYAIDYWRDVEDLQKLESGFYDIIVLDIGGVGTELDSEQEGVGVLKHLKTANPAQIVVAYSGQSHKTDRIPFFRLADQYVPKPTNAMTWKETLDDLIQSKVTVQHYWSALRALLEKNGWSDSRIRKIEKSIFLASKRAEPDRTELLKKSLGTADNILAVTSIVRKIMSLLAGAG